MKNSIKALVVVALLAIAGMANAQSSANANATANATIICPISIIDNVSQGNLEFGTIVNGPSGGTETVTTAGVSSFTGTGVGGYTGSAPHNAPHAAHFTVGGQSGFNYSVATTLVTDFGPPATVNLTGLTNSQGIQATFAASPVGCVTNQMTVGGTINFGSTAGGAFTATVNVAVAYD